MVPGRKVGILVLLSFVILFSSCEDSPVEPHGAEQGGTAPTFTSRPPTRTPTRRPKPTFTATRTVPPLSTDTDLPPIPGFSSLIDFGLGGGGGMECSGIPDKPLPFVEGGLIGDESDLLRNAKLCIWGAPFDTLLRVTLTSPGRRTILRADVLAQSNDETLFWVGQNIDESTSYATIDNSGTTIIHLDIWWPRGLEAGKWRINVQWNSGEVSGTFEVKGSQRPEISVLDDGLKTSLRSGECLQLQDVDIPVVAGEKFSRNEWAYLLVYRNTSADPLMEYRLFETKVIKADQSGSLGTTLSEYYSPGTKYILIGVSELNNKIITQGKYLNYQAVADALVCFSLPERSPSSCSGAPPQRMIVGQSGTACTGGEPVRLRISPSKSAITIHLLPVGTKFKVLGGPTCADDWSWWLIQTESGDRGWIAEGGDEIDPYFVCPG